MMGYFFFWRTPVLATLVAIFVVVSCNSQGTVIVYNKMKFLGLERNLKLKVSSVVDTLLLLLSGDKLNIEIEEFSYL